MNPIIRQTSFNPLTSAWRHPFIVGVSLIVFVVVSSSLNNMIGHNQNQSRLELRQRVELNAGQKKALIEGKLAAVQQLTEGIVAYISASHANWHKLESSDIDVLLSVLYQHTPNVRSIAIAPGNRISYVYPARGNEKALGIYYPDLKDQWPSVERAVREHRTVLAGPIRLVQGGVALAHRSPVYLSNGRYWGLISIIIDTNELLGKAGISNKGPLEYALRGKDGRGSAGAVFFGEASLFSDDNVLTTITTSAGTWQLAARPRGGWRTPDTYFDAARVLAFSLGLMVSALLYYLLRLLCARMQSQQRLRLSQFTLDKAAELILWIDAEGRIIYMNEAAARLTADRTMKANTSHMWNLGAGFARDSWPERWRTLKERGIYTLETTISKGGELVHLDTTLNYLRYGDQELAVSFSRDVSARKEAEEAMHRSQQETETALSRSRRLAHIVNRTTNAVLLTDKEGLIRWSNAAFCTMTGHTLDEVLGRKPGHFLQGPQTQADVVLLMREQLAQNQGFRVEIINYRKDGLPFWVDIEVQPILDDAGVVDGFMAIQSDISDHKRFEQRLEEAQRIAQMGFWEYDIERRSALWSDETYRIYDLPPGKPVDADMMQLVLHPDDLPAFQEVLRQAIHDDQPILNECRIIRSSGEVRHVRHIGRRVPPDQTQRVKLFGTVQDITEQKRAEGLKNEFVSVVSHELRTPLTAMRGALGLLNLTMLAHLPEQGRKLLDMSNRNCERLLLLINDLLDMEKISYGQMDFKLQSQALMPLLHQALSANQPYGQGFGVHFNLWDQGVDCKVRVDSHRLHQVLANLLSNAAKFSNLDEQVLVDGRVDLLVQMFGDRVRITVQDYGVGIDPAHHDRMFQSFSQIDASDARSRGGTGLGLAISKALIERMGGRIGFHSVPMAGSSFWIELPSCN